MKQPESEESTSPESKAAEQKASADAEKRRKALLEKLRALAEREARPGEDVEQLEKTLTEKRIETIVDLMCDGAWVSGQTDRQLAELWGISRKRVSELAAEANRYIRELYRDNDAARRQQLARSLQNMERLRRKAEDINSAGGLRVALEAEVQILTFLGLKPADKHVIKRDDFQTWSDEALERYIQTGERPAGAD